MKLRGGDKFETERIFIMVLNWYIVYFAFIGMWWKERFENSE